MSLSLWKFYIDLSKSILDKSIFANDQWYHYYRLMIRSSGAQRDEYWKLCKSWCYEGMRLSDEWRNCHRLKCKASYDWYVAIGRNPEPTYLNLSKPRLTSEPYRESAQLP
jgi:hypothetical protein